MNHKVYVILGFHVNFYHSWRGDTPDEAGFGTDIRVIRAILKILEGANARCYWDWDVYWTVQEIAPRHAPDILESVRRRVQSGLDEIVLGPYNNGANHAATAEELRAAVAWAIENPFGSGLKQVFGKVAPLYRPQEFMYTAGQNAILLEQGIQGVILSYAGIPFNALSTFIPTLPLSQRYNPLWLRGQPGEPRMALLPCISMPDLFECGGLEALLVDLRARQESGELDCDVAVHINEDADLDTWLPLKVPSFLGWFPNTGGLEEYIRVVNKYPWAEFALPSAYLASHPPQAEILVRQDLADGGFDGSYSWAEKYSSLVNWTALESSRLATYRAQALLSGVSLADQAQPLREKLWQGMDSAFFQRLVGLSTTHFGMSTPVINEERQARAAEILSRARQTAEGAELAAARLLPAAAEKDEQALYSFEVFLPDDPEAVSADGEGVLVRLPLLLPDAVGGVRLADESGRTVEASLVNVNRYAGGQRSGELLFLAGLAPGERRTYRVYAAAEGTGTFGSQPLSVLRNRRLEVRLSTTAGIEALAIDGQDFSQPGFLHPFLAYRLGNIAHEWFPEEYRLEPLPDEEWVGLQRARISTEIKLFTEDGAFTSQFWYTFTLLDEMPFLIVDVEVQYARTPARHTIHTIQQKLRRRIDNRWVETAPFQLSPFLDPMPGQPLRVWKHNYLGVTSVYELDYGQVNRKNCCLDSFNHQVTAGWVALSSGRKGFMLAENAKSLTSMAFCPMRLREKNGLQQVSLNPFGSYFGRQLDYSHLGGSGTGAALTQAVSGALHPNGPSFNGQRLSFSLLLAPYAGDMPPQQLQRQARSFFYPPGVIYRSSPLASEALLAEDVWQKVAALRREEALRSAEPLLPPCDFLANPADGAVDLVWEEPGDVRIDGYELRWQVNSNREWHSQKIATGNRWQVTGLVNGKRYRFQVRSIAGDACSEWTKTVRATAGRVVGVNLLETIPEISPRVVLNLAIEGVKARLKVNRFRRQRQ